MQDGVRLGGVGLGHRAGHGQGALHQAQQRGGARLDIGRGQQGREGGDVALWIGDALHGVFAALGAPQVVVLSLVVAIAGGLWQLSRRFAGQLR